MAGNGQDTENQVTVEIASINSQQTIVLMTSANNSEGIDAIQKELAKLVAGAGFINTSKEQSEAKDVGGSQVPNAGIGTVVKDDPSQGII